MTMSEHYIEENNLSVAWARMARTLVENAGSELLPAIVSITGFDQDQRPLEDSAIRNELDARLADRKRQTVETVASTIFPHSYWNSAAPRSQLYQRFLMNLPRLKRLHHLNKNGMYFERMITGGPAKHPNQLEFALSGILKRRSIRRSALQLGIFQPTKDHSRSARMGFPCLQQVTFAPGTDGLHINAFYAAQYAIERAYGNYLGLARLGAFLAHEMKLRLTRVTCYAGVMHLDDTKKPIKKLLDKAGA